MTVYLFYSSHSLRPIPVAARSKTERLLGSWVRIPPAAWIFVSCTVFVLLGRGLCDGPMLRPEESYPLWCVFLCVQVKNKTLYTCYEQVGRSGKDYETKHSLRHVSAGNCRHHRVVLQLYKREELRYSLSFTLKYRFIILLLYQIIKQSHYRPGQTHRVPGGRGSQVVRLSAICTGRVYPPGNIPGTHFC
jgi:hypothetical protein